MKRLLALVVLAACYVWVMCSCVTETTRTITTDKSGTVTDRTTTRKGSDPAALKLVSVAAEIYLPRRPMVVREEKADHDMRRLLRGWQGRQVMAITPEEISNRWKP